MDYLKAQLRQFKAFWQQTTPQSRFGMIGTLVVCVGLIVGVGIWSANPHYVALAENLPPEKAAEIIDELNKEKIACKLNYSGSAVLVDKSKWNRARAIANGIVPSDQFVQPSALGFGAGPSERRQHLHRQLETRLSQSISKIQQIEHATVHIYIAKSVAIESLQKDSTASVLVKMRPGYQMNQTQAYSIVMLVANAVEGLNEQNVKVMDDQGRAFSTDDHLIGGGMNHVNLRRDTEKYLQQKAERLLTQMLGPGKASVMVSAQIDIKKIDSKSKEFSPDGKVTKREYSVSEKTNGNRKSSNGIAGTTSNLTNSTGGTTANPVNHEMETSERDYDHGSIETVRSELPDWVKRLSIAAVVDLSADSADGATAQPVIDQKAIEDLIKSAVGFDDTRGDRIDVVAAKMAAVSSLELETDQAQDYAYILGIIRNSSLGMGALFALVMGFLMLRKIKPVTLTQAEPQITAERAKHLSDLSKFARQNPELLSKIVAAWINESSAGGSSTSSARSTESGSTASSGRRVA